MHGSRGGGGGEGGGETGKNQKAIGFHSNTGLDPLKSHKATNVGPSSRFFESSWQFYLRAV